MNRRFPEEVETTVYRVVQEGLTNVARHAGVDEVMVHLSATDDALHIEIEDHGQGFNAPTAMTSPNSRGLAGMRERVTLLGGRLDVHSVPGEGTQVHAEIPVAALALEAN
ncbi:MAG: ATP-binding protein [Chloroflexi bacterium]|nr:ATP-binding protein [Chloroflexota bacterium]